ncbi:MAG: rhomboid family intramembrane serine protease [Treponema sp.]|nr:rhomboid family intramembrane serine protease [Treponema sp.]
MRIKYNAPTVLSFTMLCALVLFLNDTVFKNLIDNWFMVPGKEHFNRGSFRNWIAIFTHVIGHGSWSHLINNFTLILLIGPMLEEVYGSALLLVMMFITAIVTGALNVIFFHTALLGASGIVFMMILLSSFTNFSKGEIPVTFILVLILYLGVQFFNSFSQDNISQFAHIVGGLCGSFFGFLRPAKKGNS